MKKYIILTGICAMALSLSAQKKPAKDWYQKPVSKKTMGIDLYKSYDKILKNKPAQEIVVAVIDGGTDIAHPDLKGNIWHNKGEIPFNNIDDDKNGYVDDTVGWNFIGGADGKMVEYDNLEMTRLYRSMKAEFDEVDEADFAGDAGKLARFHLYEKVKSEVLSSQSLYSKYTEYMGTFLSTIKNVRTFTKSESPSLAQVKTYKAENDDETAYLAQITGAMKRGVKFSDLAHQVQEQYDQVSAMGSYHYNYKFDPRSVVGDDYANGNERFYGNNNVGGPDPSHGTHVAGIIAALRNNGIGMNGIADHVKIMVVRVVPNGDERDKDVANGIRYAVDNGAKIINMSFGKSYKWDKALVDAAVAYAEQKGVLLIHAAGNDGKDNDLNANYPNDSLGNGKFAANWLEIGASAPKQKALATDFSNYGAANVDLFAPGYQIYSTTPNNQYAYFDGTSMAAPVTSGVAALVWSYYPKLTAVQMKEILMKSAVIVKKKVRIPGDTSKAPFTSFSVSGGVVNAYNALKLAETYTK